MVVVVAEEKGSGLGKYIYSNKVGNSIHPTREEAEQTWAMSRPIARIYVDFEEGDGL